MRRFARFAEQMVSGRFSEKQSRKRTKQKKKAHSHVS